MKHTLVPLPFIYVAFAAGLLRRGAESLSLGSAAPIIDGVLGACMLFAFFAFISLVTRQRGMGFGDAYVAASIGMLVGVLDGVNAVALGVWGGTFFYLTILFLSHVRLLSEKLRVTIKTELPFAPWLFIGAVLVLYTNLSPFGAEGWLSLLIWQ
jgi:prepilin signal peptidase PulO-like enzyme (type II secretory pathway)